jgi:pre-mRNA-processing factor SLU7
MAQLETFAWEANQREAHLQANPTQTDLMFKQHQQKKKMEKTELKDGLLAKYGGVEHLQAPDKDVLFENSEHYVEYSQTGQVIKGIVKPIARSKYAEDVFLNNHTSVWGSWWSDGKWGYKCCHSLVRNSYCTGEDGIEATAASLPERVAQEAFEKRRAQESDSEPQVKRSKQA